MKKRILVLTAMVLLLALALPMTASAYTMYVKTGNGKSVNLRDQPTTDSQAICQIPYGTAVEVLQDLNGWSAIDWPGRSNPPYIQSRFLTSTYPGPRPQGGGSDSTSGGDKVSDLNFSSFRLVNPYYVYVKASRSGGFVNLRWAPSKSASVQERVYDGSELKVLSTGRGWYQVCDERTGYVGFMMSSFLVNYR